MMGCRHSLKVHARSEQSQSLCEARDHKKHGDDAPAVE
jgi:hypothetical protein